MTRKREVAAAAFVVAASLSVVAVCPNTAKASFSGENGRFVLSWFFDGPGSGDAETELATLDASGGDFRVVAGFCGGECYLTGGDWSPNGRRISYAADWDFVERVETIRANGSDVRRIHNAGRGFLTSTAWSPDGERIAFIEYHTVPGTLRDSSDIYVIRRDGTGLRRVTHTPHLSEDDLDWSSRNRLVFRSSWGRFLGGRYELISMRPNGEGRRRLTDNDVPDHQPDWGPGGRRLVFVRSGDIWTMTAFGKKAKMIAADGHSPTWSPDGTLIAYIGADGAIHTLRPSGADPTSLGSPVAQGSISQLDWQPVLPVPVATPPL